MSNFIYYEKLEDYEEQVRKAKECDKKDKEIERLNTDKEQLTSLVNSCQEEIRKLKTQLQQKENIIKEVREYIDENVFHNKNQEEQELYDIALLEILDKGE